MMRNAPSSVGWLYPILTSALPATIVNYLKLEGRRIADVKKEVVITK